MKAKIITQIALQTAANKPLKRAFAFYFSLKTINTDGFFQSSGYAATAKALKITLPTFYSRLALLKQFNLSVNTKKQFTLISYEKACQLYNCQFKYYYTTQPDLQLTLDALAIKLKKQAMQAAFFRKLSKYPAIAESLKQITGLETNSPGFQEAVVSSLVQDHVKFSRPDNLDLYALNADDNMNYATLSTLFGYNSRGGMAYKKRKLAAAGIAKAEPRQYSINPHRYSTKAGNICYFRPDKSRVLTLCDNVILTNF